jgi:hypothetical protein
MRLRRIQKLIIIENPPKLSTQRVENRVLLTGSLMLRLLRVRFLADFAATPLNAEDRKGVADATKKNPSAHANQQGQSHGSGAGISSML